MLCVTLSSCRGKVGTKAVEVIEKFMKSGADDAMRLGIKGIDNAMQDDDNDYSIENNVEYDNINEPRGRFVVSEESGDLIYIDEDGDVHEAFLDEDGDPYIVE